MACIKTAFVRDNDVGDDEVTQSVQAFCQSRQYVLERRKPSSQQFKVQGPELAAALEHAVFDALMNGHFSHQTCAWPSVEDDNSSCRQSGPTESTVSSAGTSTKRCVADSCRQEVDNTGTFIKSCAHTSEGLKGTSGKEYVVSL